MPESALFHAWKEFISLHGLVRPADSLILAVSGGADSVVLLDLFATVRDDWNLRLVVGHFNHQLRGRESDADEEFVHSLAKKYGIDCYVERADTASTANGEHRSIQETARNLRYNFLAQLRTSLEFRAIATGHHADDNTETILFHLFRGAGVHGLTGIPIYREDIHAARPLLFATREQIQSYCDEKGLRYRDDSSNAKAEYARNFIRHSIVPLVREKINPNLTATVGRMAELFQDLEEYIDAEVKTVLPSVIVERSEGCVFLDRKSLLALPIFLQECLLRQFIREFAHSDADFLTVKALINVSRGESGTSYPFPGDAVFYHDRDRLVFRQYASPAKFSYEIDGEGKYEFDGFCFSYSPIAKPELTGDPHIECIDADAVKRPLVVRSWQYGDRFVPFGMQAEKKLSDFFTDEKVSLYERSTIPLLESAGTIVWVCGKRLDDRFKITNKTQHFIKLEYSQKS